MSICLGLKQPPQQGLTSTKRMGFPAREGRSISFSGVFLDVGFSLMPEHLVSEACLQAPFSLVPHSSRAYGSLEACGKNENMGLESKRFSLHPPRPELLGL